MKIRKCIIALSVTATLAASVNQSYAIVVIPPAPPSPLPIPYPITATATGVLVVGGFIGAIGLLCIYDFVLKLNGLKNWDGTPKSIGRDVSTGKATGKRQHSRLR